MVMIVESFVVMFGVIKIFLCHEDDQLKYSIGMPPSLLAPSLTKTSMFTSVNMQLYSSLLYIP